MCEWQSECGSFYSINTVNPSFISFSYKRNKIQALAYAFLMHECVDVHAFSVSLNLQILFF